MTSTDPIVCRYEWNAEGLVDAWKGNRRLARRTFAGRVRLAFLGLILAPFAAFTVVLPIALLLDREMETSRRLVAWGLYLGFFGWIWALVYFCLFKQVQLKGMAARQFRTVPYGSRPVRWTFEGDQVESQTDLTSSTMTWPFFIQVVETPTAFLLYQGNLIFHWVPGHGFASEREMKRFADLARSRVANYIQLGECRFVGKPRPIETDEF